METRRYLKNTFDEKVETTIGMDFQTKTVQLLNGSEGHPLRAGRASPGDDWNQHREKKMGFLKHQLGRNTNRYRIILWTVFFSSLESSVKLTGQI